MFILLISWAAKNPCLNRGFNFTLVTFLEKFSTALSVGVRDTQQCWATAAAVTGRWALESLGGSPGRGACTPTEKATSFVKIMLLSGVCCESHQNLSGDMSELLPLYLSSAAKVTASSCPRLVPDLSEGSHYIQVTPRRAMWCVWWGPCISDSQRLFLWCYLLGLQLSYSTFL